VPSSFHPRALAYALLFAGVALTAPAAFAVLPPVFSTQWGGIGSGAGLFSNPAGVALDGAGNVYVSDTGNHRIQKFDPNGAFLTQWGTLGSGNGQFNGPRGIACRAGNVFVVDAGNARIQVFTLTGAYVTQWGSSGTGNGQFMAARGICADGYGTVYVTDATLNRVQSFSSTGTFYNVWGTTGTGPGQFSGMNGIALLGQWDLYIADTGNQRIQHVDNVGTFVAQWGSLGTGNGQFNAPTDVAIWGPHVYVADRNNDRMQMFDPAGAYEAQWGTTGLGPGQFSGPRATAAMFGLVYVADGGESCRIQKFVPAPPETCAACVSPPDTCCEALPHVGGPWSNIAVVTRQGYVGYPYAVTIFDLTSPPPSPLEDTNWAAVTRYNGPGNSWKIDSLGTVFGLTLDEFGNIFVTHASCYYPDAIGQVFGAAPGAIYRIDANTGAIRTFCVLPNVADPGVIPPGDDLPGLGNISYDCRNHQFFVTNHEDGKIYRIQATGVNGPTGTVVQTFDPMAPDNGLPGWAPLGERLWGIQWHGDRVYYSVWRQDASASAGPNEIRSVALLPSGAIDPSSDQNEFYLPPFFAPGGGGSGGPGNTNSMPVADISFSASGRMLCGERGIYGETMTGAHSARALEYVCSGGCWVPGNVYMIGDYYTQTNASGGVDYDRHPFGGGVIGRAWATGDALHLGGMYPDVVYGFQGLRPNTNGTNVNSILMDSDGNVVNGDKTFNGDIEVPGCPEVVFGSICGKKFKDLNHNGVKDGGEPGLSGWTIQLNGPGGPYTATTNAAGDYCFTNLPAGSYTVSELGVAGWVQTAPAGGTYAVTLAAGQTVTTRDFGNYVETGGIPCAPPPTGMAAWWPFNDPLTSTTAVDVVHTIPSKNVAQLFGGAAISGAGYVQNALCVGSNLDYVKVPSANQAGIDFNAGPFAIDVWVKPTAATGVRMIAEKRVLISPSPYRTRGWALYLNGMQAMLELGNGVATQIAPGPTLAANAWTHIAVSVERSPASGTWYVNGSSSTSLAFTPMPGSVSPAGDLFLGQTSPAFGLAPGLQGCIDELELFASPLTAAKVAAIYNAGIIGKCPEYCRVPSVTSICKDKTSVQVCFSICNNTPTSQTYTWSLAGLPSGVGCTVAGPTSFSPPAGTVTVLAGSCSAPICVTVQRPAGLTAQNATACYALTFVNNATGASHTCSGTIRADNTCWCVTPAQTGVVNVAGRVMPGAIGTPIVIGVGGPCDPIGFPYRITAVAMFASVPGGPGEPGEPALVSLNGLPPGEPVIGNFSPSDPTGGGTIEVGAAYAHHDPAAPYEILLEADLDGDGVMEPVCATMIASTYDESLVSAPAGPRAIDSVRLLSTPNPFFRGSTVSFSLAERGLVDLAVYDLGGRRVRSLASGVVAAGAHRVEWSGADDRGRPVAAGVYFVRLHTERMEIKAKVVKLR
jgi:hypothetical protein